MICRALLCVILLLSTRDLLAQDAAFHLLVDDGRGGVAIERVEVPDGETRVLAFAPGAGPIAAILPYARGISGSLEQRAEPYRLVVRNQDGRLHPAVHRPDGSRRDMPAVLVADLARSDIRVNVTGPDGPIAAFHIVANQTVTADDVAPVADLFAGRIPIGPEDLSVTTEVYRRRTTPPVRGRAELTLRGGYLHVVGRLPDGSTADLVVDTGGGSALLLDRAALPPDLALRPGVMLQFSEEGVRELPYAGGGATGSFGVAGVVSLATLRLGSVELSDVDTEVLEGDTAEFLDRLDADGIVGLELLRRADRVAIDLPTAEHPGALIFGVDGPAPAHAVTVPFSRAMSHLIVRGDVGATSLPMIIDTGAPRCLMTREALAAAGLELDDAPPREAGGIDGERIAVHRTAAPLALGGADLGTIAFDVASLPVLHKYGARSALLGNEALARFARVELDFAASRMVLLPAAP